ncbi:MAG: helix-turn-helix domain-containing protein, partial [Pseudonocardiaceae bacterium]
MDRETPSEDAAVSQEHWTVPVRGLTCADPDGIVQAIARRDGTVILSLTCGDSRTNLRLDVGRAAQLSTGIWEAAGAAQQLTLPIGSGVQQGARHVHPHRSSSRGLRSRSRLTPVTNDAALDATRITGLRIRQIRHARGKSLRVIAGLAGMSRSTLHRIEHGQRELTLGEIVALAGVLEIAPAKLIRLPVLAPTNKPSDAERAAQVGAPPW